RTLGRIDAKTGEVTDIKVPGQKGFVCSSHAIVRDRNGIMWFNIRDNSIANMYNTKVGDGMNNGRLGRLDPKTGKVDVYTPPTNMSAVGDFLDWDGKGNIWMAAGSGIMKFDPNTKTFTEFKYPHTGSDIGDASFLYGVMGDKDGNGWWSQMSGDMEARADTETGKVEEVMIPHRTEQKDLFTPTQRKVFE